MITIGPFDTLDTLGALLTGVLISCCLLGIITVQVFTYYTRFPNDKMYLKAVVLFLWFLEAGHAICMCQGTYFLIVSVYGNPVALLNLPRVLAVSISFNGIIGPLVQIFFAQRVRAVSNQIYIPILCCTLSVARGILTFLTMARGLDMINIIKTREKVKVIIPAALGIGAAVDLILTVTLSYYIKRHMKRARLVDTTLLWTIQTGFATFVFGIAMLVSFLKMPNNFVWLGIFSFLGRMFTCALLASLNGRTMADVPVYTYELQRIVNRRNVQNKDIILDLKSLHSDRKSTPLSKETRVDFVTEWKE